MSVSTSNIFAALDTKKSKKKSSKSSKESSDKKKKEEKQPEKEIRQQHLFSGEGLQHSSNWADSDEEDDFDIDIAPLPASWLVSSQANGTDQKEEPEGSDSEEEDTVDRIHEELGLEVAKDEEEEEEEEEEDKTDDQHTGESPVKANGPTSSATAPPAPIERQISKKEKKRLELEEMNRVLAELGIAPETKAETENKETEDGAAEEPAADHQPGENGVESTISKKKKKKEKTKGTVQFDEAKDESKTEPEPEPEEESEPQVILDPTEAKKMLAKKKSALASKKSGGTTSSASLAAKEAKERAAKKAKVKDKKNYNQAPTR